MKKKTLQGDNTIRLNVTGFKPPDADDVIRVRVRLLTTFIMLNFENQPSIPISKSYLMASSEMITGDPRLSPKLTGASAVAGVTAPGGGSGSPGDVASPS